MKRKYLILSVTALLGLSACTMQITSESVSSEIPSSTDSTSSQETCSVCEPCESQPAKKITYGHYTLKDSVTDITEIEGYPWIHSGIAGMLSKVEKPEAKHDFFGYANYETFEQNPLPEDSKRDGGKILESAHATEEKIEEIMASDIPDVKATLEMLKKGAKEKFLDSVSSFWNAETLSSSATSFLSSKALFEGRSKNATLDVDESGKVHISYVLNVENINLPLILYYAQVAQDPQPYVDALTAYLSLFGLEKEASKAYINNAASTILTGIGGFSQAGIEEHVTTIETMDFDFGHIDLKAALLDCGFNGNTTVTVSDQAYQFLTALGGCGLEGLADTIALSKLFDNRFCIGVEDYRNLALNHFAGIYGLDMEDIDEDMDDEEIAQTLYLSAFPKAFDQIYIANYVSDATRERIDTLIDDVIAEYLVLFDEGDWLSESTKLAAKDKLNNMWHMSFYSDGFLDSDNLFTVTATDALDLREDYLDWYNGITTSCPWSGGVLSEGFSVTTVNAMYSANDNAFAIYHGVCSSYIGDEALSTEKLYGYIGMVIGHEISHGFDSSGANFDKNGLRNNWWTSEDRAAFQSKVDKIANYYTNSLHGYHDHNYNGSKLSGEIIADMGGVNIMLKLAEKEESFDYDEFFLAIAENFAIQETREYGLMRIEKDVHPEEYLRINVTLSQFPEFQQTYDVKEGDGMYVAQEDRLAIW